MTISTTKFIRDLCSEHLDEAAFLFEQKLLQLRTSETTWAQSQEDDNRIEAHIDALLVEQSISLPFFQSAIENYAGAELFIITALVCRIGNVNELFKLLDGTNLDDAENAEAISMALEFEAPSDWHSTLLRLKFDDHPRFVPVFLPLLTSRELSIQPSWLDKALNPEFEFHSFTLNSLAKSNIPSSQGIIATQLSSDIESDAYAAVRALLKLDPGKTTSYIQHKFNMDHVFHPVLATGCSKAYAHNCSQLRGNQYSTSIIHAIGIFGLPENIPMLISLLSNEELALDAAKALHWITGVNLSEEVFVEEDWEESDLFEDELEDFAQGIVPKHADGRPFGENVEQPVLDPAPWLQWWQTYANNYTPGFRYRFGALLTPALLVQVIESPQANNFVRQSALDELEIRYGIKHKLNLENAVALQVRELHKLKESVTKNVIQFEPGCWYIATQKVE